MKKVSIPALLLALTTTSNAFQLHRRNPAHNLAIKNKYSYQNIYEYKGGSSTELYQLRKWFRREGKGSDDGDGDGEGEGEDVSSLNHSDNRQRVEDEKSNVAVQVQVKEELSPVEKAELLRKQATRTRLEAERMDVELTLQKISALEKALQNSKTNDDKEIIQSQIDMLTKKLNPPEPKATRTESVTSSKSSDNPYEFEPISNEALQSRIDQLNNTEQFLLDLVTEAAGLKGTSDLRDLALKLHEDQYFADVSILRDNMTEFVPLTSVEIKKLEESYLNLPPLVRDMNEKQMGTTNVTDIVIRSFKENFDQQQNKAAGLRKMIPSEQIQRQSADENINTQGSWLFGDRKEKSRVDNYT